jgi:prepilin-type N-terminal cleavage/methylation domain-containing protein
VSRPKNSLAGFTLAELLVAMTITGFLSAAIFALYGTTSDSLAEADSLAETVDMARFAAETMRGELRTAGAFGTPDSKNDPWVKPKPSELGTGSDTKYIAGLVSYQGGSGWQNDQSPIPEDGQNANLQLRSANTVTIDGTTYQPSFDGIVTIGAYDFPLSFEIGGISSNGKSGRVYATERGLFKLRRNDPFHGIEDLAGASTDDLNSIGLGAGGFDFGDDATYTPITRDIDHRLLRIMDSQGYKQFVGISGGTHATGATVTNNPNNLLINFGDSVQFRQGSKRWGIDPPTQQSDDKSYDAAMLDAFWYHVVRDPSNPRNAQLVRHRLDAESLTEALTSSSGGIDWSSLDPSGYLAGNQNDYVVIADRLVDFQIWFDCAKGASTGSIAGGSWNTGWNTPDGTSSTSSGGANAPVNDCMNPTGPNPGRVRMAHVRLSMRTATERENLEHEPFPDPATDGGNRDMQTYDLYPQTPGAARVYTTQLDFELPNFSMRNIK